MQHEAFQWTQFCDFKQTVDRQQLSQHVFCLLLSGKSASVMKSDAEVCGQDSSVTCRDKLEPDCDM